MLWEQNKHTKNLIVRDFDKKMYSWTILIPEDEYCPQYGEFSELVIKVYSDNNFVVPELI